MKQFPLIDYVNHPAFVHLPQYEDLISADLKVRFNEVNSMMDEFDIKPQIYTEQEIEKFYLQTIAPCIAKHIKPLMQVYYNGNEECRQLMLSALEGFIKKLIDQSLYLNVKKQFQVKLQSSKARKVFDELNENGITLSSISSEDIREYNNEIVAYKTELKRQSDEKPNFRAAIPLPRRSNHWDIIDKNMRKSGFLEGASAFYGSNLTVTGCGLEYSNDRQQWWKNCYEDFDIPTSKCVYMHNDYDYDYVKSLVYLNEVESKDGGPFCYIPESHKWIREKSLSFYIKELERLLTKNMIDKGLGKKFYYRPAMSCKEGRELFIALPSLFRQLSHFGDDVLDGTDLSNELLSKELRITSDIGNFCFFTGGSGIHRGGTVYNGERWALQITLTKDLGISKKISSFVRNTAGRALVSILGEEKVIRISKRYKRVI